MSHAFPVILTIAKSQWLRWLGRSGLTVIGIATGTAMLWQQPTLAQRTTIFDLDQAICANRWGRAIDIIGTLVANERTGHTERSALLTLRRQLEQYRTENIIVADAEACNRTSPYLIDAPAPRTVQTGEALGWELAVAEATENRYSTRILTEPEQLTLPIAPSEIMGLSPAVPMDLALGLTVVPGHVGPGHNVHSFVAGLGDRIDVNVEVTQVMTGALYTSDDSQLFVFDQHGNLLATADDSNGQQSRISDLIVPKTDIYYAVVTSYNNDPIFNQSGQLSGWEGNGGGRFDYTLSVTGATPTSALVR